MYPRLTPLRPLLLALPLLLTGCATVSSVMPDLSSLNPMNWFSGSLEVSEQGVGGLTAATPMDEQAIRDGLENDFTLRNGMATNNGQIVAFWQALDNDKVALTITGPQQGKVARIDVTSDAIATDSGVEIGTPFSDLYSKAFGACQMGQGDDEQGVECAAPNSRHLSYVFSGTWHGPAGLMPADDTLKNWKVSKIIWRAEAR